MSITLKDGTVLPDIPRDVTSEFPYRLISFITDYSMYGLIVSRSALKYYAAGEYYTNNSLLTSGASGFIVYYIVPGQIDTWTLQTDASGEGQGAAFEAVYALNNFVWSNYDVLDKSGDVCYAKYLGLFILPDGTELPALPEGCFEKYPYGLIVYTENTAGEAAYALAVAAGTYIFAPDAATGEGSDYVFSQLSGYRHYKYVVAPTASSGWELYAESTAQYSGHDFSREDGTIEVRWSNHDILTLNEIVDGNPVFSSTLYRKSDVNYRVYGGWLNSMGNQARRLGDVSGELKPGEMETVFKGVTAGASDWMVGLHADYLSQIDELGLSSMGGMAGLLVLMMNGVSSNAVDINPAPFSFNMYTGSANLPNAENIGEFAFMMNMMLNSVTAPNLKTIGYMAFTSCFQLETLDFPLLETIAGNAFSGCSNLSSFNFASIVKIDNQAFDGCALTSVELPASFVGFGPLGGNAFTSCTALTTITVDESNENVCAVDNVLYTKSMGTLLAFPAGVTTFTTPEDVTVIGKEAFYGNKDLTKIDLLENVSTIGESAFASCSALTALILRRQSAIVSAGETVLGTISSSGVSWYIYVPSALLATYQANENWSTYAAQFRAIEDYPDICGTTE